MEFRLYKGMFDENDSLFGMALRTSTQAPNELKYWFGGYAFYRREDGQIFAEQMEELYKDNFYWNICGIEQDFDLTLEQADEFHKKAVNLLERLTNIAKPYGVAPVSFTPQLSRRNELIITNLVFITTEDKKYFEVATTKDFYNIKTKTVKQFKTFEENTLANPHLISVDENGRVDVAEKIVS